MLHTFLTTSWQLRYPIIGAPMAYVGRGRLAHAVSQAGALGMIGIGSTESVDFLAREAAIARGPDQGRFGIGMHAWAIERRPDLLDAIYKREEITGARCTPLDSDDNSRMRALRTIFSKSFLTQNNRTIFPKPSSAQSHLSKSFSTQIANQLIQFDIQS